MAGAKYTKNKNDHGSFWGALFFVVLLLLIFKSKIHAFLQFIFTNWQAIILSVILVIAATTSLPKYIKEVRLRIKELRSKDSYQSPQPISSIETLPTQPIIPSSRPEPALISTTHDAPHKENVMSSIDTHLPHTEADVDRPPFEVPNDEPHLYTETNEPRADSASARKEFMSKIPSPDDGDPMMNAAIDVVVETGMASVSSLQRKLKLGYSRAARLVDQMEQIGVVGPFEGSKPRKVLITKEQWTD